MTEKEAVRRGKVLSLLIEEKRKMEKFVSLIQLIDKRGDKTTLLHTVTSPGKIVELERIASKLFITREGKINRRTINTFKTISNWDVGPGERRGSEWINGIIYTDRGMLVFD